MTGVPSKPPSRNISPMILSEAPLPYISAVSKRVTPSAMLARKALPTSLRSYSLPYPQSLVVPHAQAPIPRGATFISSARPIESLLCKASPLIPMPRSLKPTPRYFRERAVSARSRCGKLLEAAPNRHYDHIKPIAKSRIAIGVRRHRVGRDDGARWRLHRSQHRKRDCGRHIEIPPRSLSNVFASQTPP